DERLLDPDLDEIRAELAAHPAVRSALDRLWPRLTAQQLVGDLLASPERLAAAGGDLDPAERALLHRPAAADDGPGWTPADVPLLDEAAVLLGDDGARARRAEARQAERDRAELAYAREVLANTSIGDAARYTPDTSAIDPSVLAGRWRVRGPADGVADRARQDRTWVFGHVIVDEAQELSPMAWRMVMRRSPSRSMTVVGDVAQTGAPWGPGSWAQALDPPAAGRWRVEELTINYRTPAEIMAVAADVLASLGTGLEPPRSAREGGTTPWRLRVGPGELAARLPAVVAAEADAVGDGKLAVLVPTGRAEPLAEAIGTAVPAATSRQGPAVLDAPVVVLTVGEAKGLEFDAVVVVDPAAMLAAGPHGANDLYVALTRTTNRLGVVHPGDLPPLLARLGAAGGTPGAPVVVPAPDRLPARADRRTGGPGAG
ncbi:MAG TPA: ATP-binding domain-containing protein, partial [Actinomycetota bacterium]|nr:ATP-binding domain-containing protein [Actinomycetota bacterium]